MSHYYSRKHWIIGTIIIVFVLIIGICVGKIFAMGKKPLAEINAVKVENAKLADRVTGVEQANLKLADKLDGVVSAQVGMNNTVSKVTSDIKAGRDVINDSQLMTDYIQSMKDSHKEVVDTNWKIINGLLIEIGILVSLLGWCLKFLLKADERRDIREEKREQKEA
ncbi:MAG: hypothetical protein WC390_09200 [Sulfurimonas sp.]|jgi:hypothetical protein